MNHIYAFSLSYSNNESRYVGVSAVDLACAESMARLHKVAGEPPLRCILVSVDREGDGCGDERCAVCHPSSRNDHSASRRVDVLQAEAPHLIAQPDIVPMQSARIREGVYEVLGTSTACVVERCANGRWVLESGGEWVASFDTKRDALRYCQEHPEL